MKPEKQKLAGLISNLFIKSKLTPIIVIASLLLGLGAIWNTPKEEEPQIVVPMIDIQLATPGMNAPEAERFVTEVVERENKNRFIEECLKGRDLERTVFIDDDSTLLEAAESHFLGLRTVHVSNRKGLDSRVFQPLFNRQSGLSPVNKSRCLKIDFLPIFSGGIATE
ncbi:hypothetical protein EBR57_02460 [bacterium]|nr:hypothetical protein [bacterium]